MWGHSTWKNKGGGGVITAETDSAGVTTNFLRMESDWWEMHEEVRMFQLPTHLTRQSIVLTLQVLKMLQKQAVHIQAWWEFTGRPDPGQDQILASLQRLVSGVLTHPITIGKVIDTYTPKRKKGMGKISHD